MVGRSPKKIHLLAVAILLSPTAAHAIVVDSLDSGWYRSDGTHRTSNTNILNGTTSGFSPEYRNFQAFDLSSVPGSIAAATLIYCGQNGTFSSDKGTETIQISESTANIDELLDGVLGLSAFNDLGAGNIFGNATVTQSSGTVMPAVSVALTSRSS